MEAEHPALRVVRLRPGLIFQERAGLELRRYFLPRLPGLPAVLRPGLVDRVPTGFQDVHAIDVARVFAEAALGTASGAFKGATDDVVGGRHVPALRWPARAAASLTWRAHLQPVDPGWVRLVFGCPLLDSGRARAELGWMPRVSGHEALAEGLEGMRTTRRAPTAALRGEGAPPEAS